MSLPKNQAWFPSKKYGYGWGLPQRWPGWLVLIAYLAGLGVAPFLLQGAHAAFLVYTLTSSAVLVFVCFWKGEPARWRWGGE